MTKNIEKLSMTYMRYGVMVAVALALVGLMVMQIWFLDLLTPIIVSVAFSLVTCVAIAQIWKRVALSSPDSLPTFFTAVSGFRLLLALAVMFVYYLVAGRDKMLPFFLVFMVFYLVSLAHHSIFFARINNR